MTTEEARQKLKQLQVEQALLDAQPPLFAELDIDHEERKARHLRKLRAAQRRLDKLNGEQHEQ